MTGSMSRTLFQALTRSHSPADGLTDAARRAEPANGLRHVAALSMSKVADGLIDQSDPVLSGGACSGVATVVLGRGRTEFPLALYAAIGVGPRPTLGGRS